MISPVACAVPNRPEGAPKLFGGGRVRLQPGSRIHAMCGREEVEEEYFCNYEVNPEYEARLEAAGLPVVARGPQGEVRAVELPERRFFVATLFQPQLSSRPEKPHPLVMTFLRAAAAFQQSRLASTSQSVRSSPGDSARA